MNNKRKEQVNVNGNISIFATITTVFLCCWNIFYLYSYFLTSYNNNSNNHRKIDRLVISNIHKTGTNITQLDRFVSFHVALFTLSFFLFLLFCLISIKAFHIYEQIENPQLNRLCQSVSSSYIYQWLLLRIV